MKQIRVGLAIAGSLCLLLLAALWATAQAQSPEPPQVEINQAPTFDFSATVGADPNRCATSSTAQVRANTPVYYCFTLRNTGPVTLTVHQVSSARKGVITTSFSLLIAPGVEVNTLGRGLVVSDTTASDVTDDVTWIARAAGGAGETSRTARVAIDIVNPAVAIIKTVGQNRQVCGSDNTVRIPSGQNAYFCLTLENQGDVAFTRHTLVDTPQGINGTFAYTLAPQGRLVITPGVLPTLGIVGSVGSLERGAISAPFTNTVTLRSSTDGAVEASAASTASVTVGTTTVVFSKTVGTDPNGCATTTSLAAVDGTRLYYCVYIRNTGATALTRHALVEPALSIDLRFDYDLAPGSLLTVTNAVLTDRFGLPPLFGPFEFSTRYPAVVNSTMTYSGSAPGGFLVTTSASTGATFLPTPTPTSTDAPDPTETSTPFPTFTPSITPIPPTATPSPTPTFTPVTPSPTPTRDYTIFSLETPTPGQLVPQPLQAPPASTPTPGLFVDPNAFPVTLTAEAAAVEATATAAAQFFSPLPAPDVAPLLPTPELAPAPLPPLPSAELTEAQPPSEPLAEPPPATLPGVEPGAPLATPATLTPAATLTQVVVVVVVTNTPAPATDTGTDTGAAAPLPEGQRPIVLPTATPTPDLLLAAATLLDSAAVAFGWIWFALGSLVFFASAGIVAGLFFRRQERRRYELVDVEEVILLSDLPPYPAGAAESSRATDEAWPDDLP